MNNLFILPSLATFKDLLKKKSKIHIYVAIFIQIFMLLTGLQLCDHSLEMDTSVS